MMKGHEVKRASNGEPLVEFGLLLCVWNKKRFSGAPGVFFQAQEIYVISLSTGIWKEERKQDYRKL